MRFFLKRFVEEFFLYSSQFIVFFILMLFLIPAADSLRPSFLFVLVGILIIQIALLAGQGHNPFLRFLYSFLTPGGYSLVRILSGGFVLADMANVFLWGSAFYVGLFQALALAPKNRWIKRVAEGLLALGAVLVFVFLYFYLDLRISLGRDAALGTIGLAEYRAALDIRSFLPLFMRFIESPQHAFFSFGAATFGFMLLANKVKVLSLRARIASLFGEAKVQGPYTRLEPAEAKEGQVVVLSADIRDFTGFSAKLPPGRAVEVLNRYYALWAAVSSGRGGRVVSVTGDSVLVIFGLAGEKDAAEAAVASAESFFAELSGLKDDLVAASMPVMEGVTVGIHAGNIVAGELGLPGELGLGVFGDAISVAARLDSLCREFKQELLLSQTVFRQLSLESQTKLQRLGEVLLRNSTQPVPVYGRK